MKTGTNSKLRSIGNQILKLAEEQDFIEDREQLNKLASIIDDMVVRN